MNDVKCLLIPRYWLLAHNESNIWCRILQFLKRWIPTTDNVFNEYVAERQWLSYKKELTKSLLRKSTTIKSISTIPYSIRVNYDYESE